MVTTGTGYIMINDGSELESRVQVFLLNRRCNVTDAIPYGGRGALDPEDVALSPDRKTAWIADIGDLEGQRETVALWRMPADGSNRPQIHRLRYPDGAKDAEALLIGQDGVPIIVTKGAKAQLYKPTAPTRQGTTTPLQKVGEVTLPKTTTSNPLGPAGRVTVTGGATSPDGGKVVLRTYADAFEWDVEGGDIVASLTNGKPRITPLPDEPWGEAIAYSADGKTFLTVSETAQQEDLEPAVLRYTPVQAAPAAPANAADGAGGGDTRSFFDKLTLGDVTRFVGAVGVLGLLLVAAGVIGILRARRAPGVGGGAAGLDPDDDLPVRGTAQVGEPATEFLARVRQEPRYGGYADPGDRPPGGVYGGGGYRSGRPADEYAAPARGAEYRSGGEYHSGTAGYRSGGEYRSGPAEYRSGAAEYRSGGVYGGRAAPGGNGHANNGYPGGAGNGYGNAYADDYADGYGHGEPEPQGGGRF
jgi:hypothetical protein